MMKKLFGTLIFLFFISPAIIAQEVELKSIIATCKKINDAQLRLQNEEYYDSTNNMYYKLYFPKENFKLIMPSLTISAGFHMQVGDSSGILVFESVDFSQATTLGYTKSKADRVSLVRVIFSSPIVNAKLIKRGEVVFDQGFEAFDFYYPTGNEEFLQNLLGDVNDLIIYIKTKKGLDISNEQLRKEKIFKNYKEFAFN